MTDEISLPVAIGELVGDKYKVERVLGVGGMGVVLGATHVALGQPVAIKFLLPEARAVSGMAHRFANEARASARLRSAHVARILDVDALEDGTPYMVMEYLEGRDLAAILTERGRVSAAEASGYVLQACEALAEAHARGIIHRDLKPGNLFIATTADGGETLKLLDFGISKHVAPEGPDFSLTKTSAVLGSPLYMPPEQMSSARTVDTRADIWSLGIVLYEAVTGTMPFEGMTLTGLVANIIQEPPRPIADTGITPPEGFEAVVLRCLEKSPAHRFATVGELAHALAPFAPLGSAASIERISRLEAQRPSLTPSLLPPPRSAPPPSDPPPMDLVRVRVSTDVPHADTIATAGRPPGASITHAAQMLEPRSSAGPASLPLSEPRSRGPGPIIALLVVTGGALLAFLYVRGGASDAHPERGAPLTAAPPPPSGDLPPPEPVAAATDSATPAPPATFSAEPAAPKPPPAPFFTPRAGAQLFPRPAIAPLDRPPPSAPLASAMSAPRAPTHPPPPRPAAQSTIDMEPK